MGTACWCNSGESLAQFFLHLLDHGWLVVVMRLSPGLAEVPPYIEPARASEDGWAQCWPPLGSSPNSLLRNQAVLLSMFWLSTCQPRWRRNAKDIHAIANRGRSLIRELSQAVSSGYPNPTRYPGFHLLPDLTRFSFENHRVAGNPKYWVLPEISCKPGVSGITRYIG